MTSQTPHCKIIGFPVDREIATVKETARILSVREAAAAERFWQMTQRRLYARLQVQGFLPDEIATQMKRFADAVIMEMNRFDESAQG